jgi:hypothetical protein
MGSSITSTRVATPRFCKIPPPRSRKIANRQSGIQKARIRWHCSQIKITMGFSFAHGTHLGGSPPVVLFHLGLCGAVFPAMSLPGPAGVWPASGARSSATHAWSPSPSPSRSGIFLIYMLIWWAHCSTVIILIILLLSLIARPSGWKPSPFQKRPRRHAQKL